MAPESHLEALGEQLNHGPEIMSTNGGHSIPELIDVDSLPDAPPLTCKSGKSTAQGSSAKPKRQVQSCNGIVLKPPPGKSAHTLYPFALHEMLGDSWDYSVTSGKFILRSRSCDPCFDGRTDLNQCESCRALSENPNIIGIINRIQDGVHASAPFQYHGVGGLITVAREKTGNVRALRLRRLNDAKKLVVKVRALDMHKQFIMAIGSMKVERVERLIKASIAQNCGIQRCLELLDKAAQQVYRTRNYTEEDELRGLLLWRLGGGRVADIAHCALGLPSVRTLRRRTLIPRLTPSAGQPTLEEIISNTVACTSVIKDVLKSNPGVVHQVLMFDEIKVEERPRWDDKTNNIIGVCREHSKNASLQYTSKDEVDLLLAQINDEKVHLATNVCSYNYPH